MLDPEGDQMVTPTKPECGVVALVPSVLADRDRPCVGPLLMRRDFYGPGKHLYRCAKHTAMIDRYHARATWEPAE